jgi:hypothetical protein
LLQSDLHSRARYAVARAARKGDGRLAASHRLWSGSTLIAALALIAQLMLAPVTAAMTLPYSAAPAGLTALRGQNVVRCTHDVGDQPDAPAHSSYDNSGICCHRHHAIPTMAICVPSALPFGTGWRRLPRPPPPKDIIHHETARALRALPCGPPDIV